MGQQMTHPDRRRLIEDYADLVARLEEQLRTAPPEGRWLAQRDLAAMQERLAHARQRHEQESAR